MSPTDKSQALSFNSLRRRGSNRLAGAICAFSVLALVAITFAMAPLYRFFSDATGYNGTVRVAVAAPAAHSDVVITVLFDTNLGKGLDWRFRATQRSVNVNLGEVAHVTFLVENLTDGPLSATALPIVTPTGASAYFEQLDCFCSTTQTLQGGEQAELGMSFFVDPAYASDAELDTTSTITLSFTLYPVKPGQRGQ